MSQDREKHPTASQLYLSLKQDDYSCVEQLKIN